ncbi:MAG TPA: DUF6491 family protein [Caulobacteraceae bacterium]|nr:DUF6491 family protein [Caulobacteraceae bacterium]
MKTPALAALALALAAFAAAPVPASPAQPPASRGQCFYVTQADGYRAADARTVYARVSGRQIWRIDLKAPCDGLVGGSQTLVVEPSGSGSICGPLDLNLYATSHGVRQRCLVGQLTRLSDADAAALPAKLRP